MNQQHACPFCEKGISENLGDLEYSYAGYERYDNCIVEDYHVNCPHCGKLILWEEYFKYECTELHKN